MVGCPTVTPSNLLLCVSKQGKNGDTPTPSPLIREQEIPALWRGGTRGESVVAMGAEFGRKPSGREHCLAHMMACVRSSVPEKKKQTLLVLAWRSIGLVLPHPPTPLPPLLSPAAMAVRCRYRCILINVLEPEWVGLSSGSIVCR